MSYFSFVKKWNEEQKLPWRDAIKRAREDYYDDKKAQTILTVKLPKKVVGILREPKKREIKQYNKGEKRMLTLLDPKSSKKIVLKATPYVSKKDVLLTSLKKKKKDLGKNSGVKLSTSDKSGEKKSSLLSLYRKRKDKLPLSPNISVTHGEENKIQDLEDEEIEIYRDAYSKYFRPNPNENMKQRAISLLNKLRKKYKESADVLKDVIARYNIQLKKDPDLKDVVIAIVNKEAELGLIIPEF
jgi:hypothetical protein